MKNLFKITLTVLSICTYATIFAQSSECAPPKYMRQALVNVVAKGILLNSLTDFGYNKGACLMGTYLEKSETVEFTLYLNANTQYAFVGGGDDDVRDLDIFLYNSSGKEVAKDTKTDNAPVTSYTPDLSGNYTVKLKMFDTQATGSFAALIVLSDKGGYTIPISNFKKCMNNLFEGVTAICSAVTQMGFLSTSNQWAMFGAVLNQGESTTISNIRLSSSKKNAIFGTGDSNISDMDIFLYDHSGTLLKKDDKEDKTPLIIWEGNSIENYKLEMKNASSSGKSLTMTTIVEIKN